MAKIVVIRISGKIGIPKEEENILYSLRLRKKYSCILLKDKKILEKVKRRVAFGEIDNDTLKLLISKRARKPGNKPVQEGADAIIKKLEEGKNLQEIGIKPFFRLAPPKGGFKKGTRLMYPKGILGENEKINELVRRML